MARTIEIPRENWAVYFERLGRQAQAYPVRIEVENQDIGDQEMARRLPLMGIDLETKGSESGDLEVTVGDADQNFMHHIDDPVRVYLKVEDSGNIDCMEIEDAANGKTLIFFERHPGLPATVLLESRADREEPVPGP
ncbi:DUF5335 family protein [Archangium violaceum]|uniref:DUF5335 domain-containing protein n=1 Tax=Archangium violaceum TaxID=83451 RepID=UPI00194E5ECB|nr:DUF5335 domain-containing protein [Archangium violaceum]QRN95592.1 DUF5335 family protein [Archangium violaceum]